MTHKITLSNGTELELTDGQAEFAFCWVNKKGELLNTSQDLFSTVEEYFDPHPDCQARHLDT
jgi:hypothetical protein